MPKPFTMKKRGQKREIVFDPEARRDYLRGFSARKRERRAFGLAMQRVKDRKSKIEQRAQERKDELERIEQAEKQKEELFEVAMGCSGLGDESDINNSDDDTEYDSKKKSSSNGAGKEDAKNHLTILDTKRYDDKQSEKHWGGHVTVTTSVVDLGVNSDEEGESSKAPRKSVDVEQKLAGRVDKYFSELKGSLPGKKSRDRKHTKKRKGKNGASEMKGMGGAANLKMAQKLLAKTKAKHGPSGQKKLNKKKSRR